MIRNNMFKEPTFIKDGMKIFYLRKHVVVKLEYDIEHCIKVDNMNGGLSIGLDPISKQDVLNIHEEYEKICTEFLSPDVYRFEPLFKKTMNTMKFFQIDNTSLLWINEEKTYPWQKCPKHFVGRVSLKILGLLIKEGVGYPIIHIDQVLMKQKEDNVSCIFKN